MVKECEWCGGPFTPPRRNSRTCSAVCRGKHNRWEQRQKSRKPRPTARCTICGVDFVMPRSDSTYCAKPECFKAAKRARMARTRVPKRGRRPARKCEWCGGEFRPTRSDAKRCSEKCNRAVTYARGRETAILKASEWNRANRHRRSAISQNAKVKRGERESTGWINPRDWDRTVRRFGHRCAYCKGEGDLHMDHVVPLSRGGTHTIGNVVPACPPCNLSKHSRFVTEWRVARTRADRLVAVAGVVA